MNPREFLGLHRVANTGPAETPEALPQAAWRLDNDIAKDFDSEIRVTVETLNIDAASFRQMEEAGDVAELVLQTVQNRGKQHNPVTGSGGMLRGMVARVGKHVEGRGFRVGDRVATLASLSLTPLHVDEVLSIRSASAQVDIRGTAFVFASAPLAKLPADLAERVALAALDVAGAAPQVARLAASGDSVLIIGGGGKSGVLAAFEARKRIGPTGKLVAVESHPSFVEEVRQLQLYDHVIQHDATHPVRIRDAVRRVLPDGADLTLSCVNVPGCEMSAILSTRDRGRVYFFAMSTSFTACALGAEGIGADVDLYIGNGYAHGHAEHTLGLLRETPALLELFVRRYGS